MTENTGSQKDNVSPEFRRLLKIVVDEVNNGIQTEPAVPEMDVDRAPYETQEDYSPRLYTGVRGEAIVPIRWKDEEGQTLDSFRIAQANIVRYQTTEYHNLTFDGNVIMHVVDGADTIERPHHLTEDEISALADRIGVH